jgi:heptosyltransferase-2
MAISTIDALPAASTVEPHLRLDCRSYRGDRPCAAGVPGVCPAGCERYRGLGRRILVIKLGALGDVVRTAALLPGLKARWPESQVTWVTRPAGVRMLTNHPLIDRLMPLNAETLAHLDLEAFDLCLSLDKEPGPAGLAMRVRAAERRGIGLSRCGTVFPLTPAARAYFALGLDDAAKFHANTKSYPQLVYEAVGLPYAGQRYRLYPGPAERRRAGQWRAQSEIAGDEIVIGLNTGAGAAFANKTWAAPAFARLARMLVHRHGWRVALLGGRRERVVNREIAAACHAARVAVRGRRVPGVLDACAPAYWGGRPPAELEFAALVEHCRVLVSGDSLAMHVAIAADVPCVVLFGPTCAVEIDLFGRGTKLSAGLPCAPCYRRHCDRRPSCLDALDPARVLAAVETWAEGRHEGTEARRHEEKATSQRDEEVLIRAATVRERY